MHHTPYSPYQGGLAVSTQRIAEQHGELAVPVWYVSCPIRQGVDAHSQRGEGRIDVLSFFQSRAWVRCMGGWRKVFVDKNVEVIA